MELLEYHFNNLHGNLYYDERANRYEMFSGRGKAMHINYLTFKELFKNMLEIKEPIILESGISSYGINSTHLFNEYVRKYGGQFWSCDINPELVNKYRGDMCPGSKLICDDSVSFFSNWSLSGSPSPDVIYLDSYDLDFYNPEPSAEHCLKEYNAILPSVKRNTLLLIDDTPSAPYWMDFRDKLYYDMIEYYKVNNCLPGKGMSVIKEPKNADMLIHNYQVLYKFK